MRLFPDTLGQEFRFGSKKPNVALKSQDPVVSRLNPDSGLRRTADLSESVSYQPTREIEYLPQRGL